ncbi:Sec-independent protein translocase subunit TatA [Peterkaempfera bronchialis]|uniref:Sec-independent protein translocase protein TatA n=1 Tax=Peterkaempfera bronchialis TaxID=2126346 RepID=A0A345SYC3_9ACTN|nr:Sec-independent protein translocase subunit TatA [Peterkaempfera bronchialis]AXI78728.1 twin-arginine translocase TatA/TatE family subunit [Peterkaempfera bronchialis]
MLRNGLEPWHLLIVVVVIVLLFGSKKLPDAARALGTSLRILKSEARAMKEDGGHPAEPEVPRPVEAAAEAAPAPAPAHPAPHEEPTASRP